jgi:hypothetical protein|tara:strand:- start:3 stop:266 length:264 start_codon:yes stop_codon:yes gene_type:complete
MKVHKSLLGGAGNALENRKLLNFWARFIIAIANSFTFLFLIGLLFFVNIKEDSRDLINILIGSYVAVIIKISDHYFKDRKETGDEEN